MVTRSDDYRWSSHQAYLGERTEAWITTALALSMFHSQLPRAIAAYRRFMSESIGREGSSPSETISACLEVMISLRECSASLGARASGKRWMRLSQRRL